MLRIKQNNRQMDNILEIRNVVKNYSSKTAIDNVSFDVPRGEVFGMLGPNGAGKTTMIRMINQITLPTKARYFSMEKS